jgi:mono/diheme cytochrome c family protein
MRSAVLVGIAGVVLAAAMSTSAQGPRQGLPPLVPESLVGSVSFDLYCASCHGRNGRGDGPTAAALKARPADLTVLARGNGGVFPRDRVLAFIEGSQRAASHGSPEMPVWGPTLRALDASDARVTVRLQNLVAFVASMQQGPAVPPVTEAADGAALFRTYCANCHGTAGRGDGAMAAQLRRLPPDLSSFAVRNGGVFPGERIRQVIDGTGVTAHGDREMPVWGAVFKRSSGGNVSARIDAIVRFLEALQQRPA